MDHKRTFTPTDHSTRRSQEILYPLFSPKWIFKPQQLHYLYYRDRVFMKRDLFMPINNANGMKFLEFLKLKSPLDLSKASEEIKELNLDQTCEDKINLPKKYTNLLYIMASNGKLYQDTQMKPGLVGFTTNKYRLEKVLGVSSFRLFLFTSAVKITGATALVSLLLQAIEIRKRERRLFEKPQSQ